MRGTVKFFKADKGFGFIVRDDGGEDVFFHQSECVDTVDRDDVVEFEIGEGRKGKGSEAKKVRYARYIIDLRTLPVAYVGDVLEVDLRDHDGRVLHLPEQTAGAICRAGRLTAPDPITSTDALTAWLCTLGASFFEPVTTR